MSAKNKKTILTLLGVYLLMSVFRFLLALATSNYPTTIPDEFLYYSIARSLAGGEGALFYGQQANFSYLLYPFMLSLIYRLPQGTNYFRLMQLVSILVMDLSLFPLYGLGKKILSNEKKALRVAALSLLLPDFILGQRVLSESLLYPLFFLMLFLAFSEGILPTALAGVAGGLLFAIKPGQVVMPAVLILLLAIDRMRTDRKAGLKQLAAGCVPMLVTAAVLLIINMFIVNPGTTLFSVYDEQITLGSDLHLDAFFRGLALSPYTFLLAMGVLPVLIPVFRFKAYEKEQRILLMAALLSAAVMLIGTAWVVNRVEYGDPTVHTRYIAVFIPVFLMLLFAAPESRQIKNGKDADASLRSSAIAFGVYAVVFVLPIFFFRYDGAINPSANTISFYALSWAHSLSCSWPGSLFVTVLVAAVLFCAWFFARSKNDARVRKTAIGVFCAFILINSICAYAYMASYYHLDDGDLAASEQMREAIGDEDYLDVFGNMRVRYDSMVDVNIRDSKKIVYINDLYNNMQRTKGVYVPFLPDAIHGDKPDRLTDDVSLMLMDRDAVTHVELSPAAEIVCENRLMTLIRFTPGERCFDSMLGGPVGRQLPANTNAYFLDFRETGSPVLAVSMTFTEPTQVVITAGGSSYSFDLPAGTDTYRISTNGAQQVCLSADKPVTIDSYKFTE